MMLTTSPFFNSATRLLEERAAAYPFNVSADTAACPMLFSFAIPSVMKPTIATNRANSWKERARLKLYMHSSGQTATQTYVHAPLQKLDTCPPLLLSTYRNSSRHSSTDAHP